MSLKGAIDLAIKNSYDIKIAKNYSEIGKINNTLGIAGALPYVNASASDNSSINNIDLQQSNGNNISSKNVNGNTLNAGLNAGIVLFNGFKIQATKEKLNSLQKQGDLQLNLQIQNTIASVMIKYYDIFRQESYLKIIQSSHDVSKKKLDIITDRKNVGMANEADLLQAQIDVNIAEQNIYSQQLVIEQDKTDLLKILSVKNFFPFEISDTIAIDKSIKMDSIINYLNQNPQYLSYEQQIKINEQVVREVASQRYPSVKLNTSYIYNRVKSDAGLTLLNQSYGPALGLSLQIPIYYGNTFKIQQQSATYNLNNSKLQKESLLNSLTSDAMKIYQSYSTTLQQLISQQKNYDLSSKLVNIVLDRFKLNQATILDLKAAQDSFEKSANLLVNLQFAAKASEIELKRLVYKLEF